MSGTVLFFLIVYAALGAFVAVVGYRCVKLLRMPMHLRWELYPVAHEAGDKPKYGGSRLEELDWWTKPQESSMVNELRYMIPEMTLLVALFEHNRKLWYRSFPFHFGIYILAGFIGLLVVAAGLQGFFDVSITGTMTADANVIGVIVYYLLKVTSFAGLGLATLGCLGLLHYRLFDTEVKDYTSFGHVFNLLFFGLVLAGAWVLFYFSDVTFATTLSFVYSLITFSPNGFVFSEGLATVFVIEVLLAVALIAYIPMTHMSHFFIKWFTYHKIRWEDEANEVGSEVEKKVMEQVAYPVTWAAPHIKGDGKKNWVDVATEEME